MTRHPSTWWIFIIIFFEFLFPKFVKAISYRDRTKNHLFQVTNSSGNGTLYGNFPEIELKALEALYFSANGMNWAWINTPNAGTIWNFQDPYVNPCIEKWQGIFCIYLPASNESVVYSLILNEYNLTGTIPDSISNLHNMTLLNLENNNLFGNIPANLFNLPYLTELILDGNRLIGNLPNNITSNLMLLSLEYNRLTGSLPVILGNLRFLQFLLLSNNNFSQEVPISIYSNSLLIELDLRWNAFIGTIPIDLRNLTSLQSMQIAHNKLYGPLPNYFPSNIRVIDFSYNLFTGKLEKTAFQQCNHLNRIELEYNSLNGELTYEHFQFVDSLFQLNLGNNFFNGNPFSSLNLQDDDDDNNGLSMLIQDGRIDEVSNDGIVVPIRNETWYISLIVFDLSNNLFTGLLPTFPTEDIIYYQVNNNYFSGPVNKQLTTSNILESFDIGNNYVTGTIGFNHSYPSFLNISYNLLTGNLQNFFYPNVNLSILPASSSVYGIILGHNFFTGTIPQYFLHFPALSILDVNNNQLTGTLPNFQNASALAILIASTNCFHGSIPLTLCEHSHDVLPSHKKQLQVIILDGLSSSINCQVPLFSQLLNIHGSFSLKHYISNGFPTCLLQLSVLQILQLSGNGLTGEIKDHSIPYISSTLTNLDLSHNLLSGTIPNHIQNRYWESLDLSYNSFSGELSSSFYNNTLSEDSVINNHDDDDDDTGINNNNDNNGSGIPDSTTASIYLNVNHLSGMIPSTLLKAETINILDGNMFTCNLNRQKYLPLHDPKYHSYTCGSDLVDLSLFFWCGLVGVLLCIGMILMIFWNRFHSHGNEEIKEKNLFHYLCWIVSYPFVSMKYSIEIISFWYFYFHHYCQEKQQEQEQEKEKEKQMKGINNNFSMNSILLVQSFHEKVNKISFSICCCIFFIFLPMFSTLTVYYSTYTYKYAWTISGLFLSGYETGIILSICMFLFFLYISGLIITNWIVQITWKPYLKITYDPRIFRIPKKRKKRSRNKLRKLLILRQQQQQQLQRQSQQQQQDQGVAKTRLISIESTRSDNRFRRTNRLRSDTGPRDDRIRSNTSNVPYEITEEQRKREEKKEFIEKLLKVLIYFIVFIINLIVMINADITYVIVIVNDSTSLTILAEIALAILKIFWNNFFLWKILSFVRKRIMIRYWKYYFLSSSSMNQNDNNHNNNSNLNSNEINLFDLQKLENEEEFHAHQSKLLHFKELDVSFISLNIGLNNFLYPIIAIMIVSTRCLYNAIFPAPEVSTLFTSNGTIIGFPVTSQSSYDPPFTYSYQCSSVIYSYYCPVFIIMLILEAFIMPIVKLRVRLWMDTKYRENPEILRNIQKMKNEENNNQWTSSSSSSSLSSTTKRDENPKNPIRNSAITSSSASSLINGIIPPTNSIITTDSARGRGKSFTNRLRSISSSTRDRENSSAISNDIEMKDFSFSTSPSLRKQEDSSNQKETINQPTATKNSQQGEGQHHPTFADTFHYYLWTSWFPINSTVSSSSSSSGSQQIPILFDKDRYVVRLNSYLLILVVYGTIFPPLAVLACIAIYSHTFFTTILLGRLLSMSTILTTSNPYPPVPAVQSSSPNAEGLTGKIKRIFFIPMKFIQFPSSSSSSLIHSFEKLSFLLTLKNNHSIYQPFQWYEQQLMNDCQGLMIPLKYTLIVLLSIAMFLFGFLIFDILGRTVNPRKASIPGFIFACYTICLIYFSFRLYRQRPKNSGPSQMEKPSRSSSLPPPPPPPHSSGSRKWTKENLGQEGNDLEENKNHSKTTRSIVVDNNGNDHQDNVDGHENDNDDDDYDENNDRYFEEYDDDDAEDEGDDDDDDEEEGDLTIKTFEFRFTGFWSAASSSFSSNRGPSLFGRRTTGGNRPSENNNHHQIALNPMQQPSAVTAEEDK